MTETRSHVWGASLLGSLYQEHGISCFPNLTVGWAAEALDHELGTGRLCY